MTNLINHPAINIVGEEWNAIMKNVSIAQYKVANRQWQRRRVAGSSAAHRPEIVKLFKKSKIRTTPEFSQYCYEQTKDTYYQIHKKKGSIVSIYLYIINSMTTLLTHTVAHSTKPSFMPKTNNQPLKKFLSLSLS